MLGDTGRRTQNRHPTVPQCEDAIQKWLHGLRPADPVHAFELAVHNWSTAVYPKVSQISGVEKDSRTDIPLKRGPSLGTRVPAHRTRVTVLGERGTHPSVSGLPSLGLGGPSFVRGPCVPWNRVHGTRLMAPFLRKLPPPLPRRRAARPSEMGYQSFLHGVPQAFGTWEPLPRKRGTRS